MVELVDTRDLKSLDPKRSCGFESRSRHRLLSKKCYKAGYEALLSKKCCKAGFEIPLAAPSLTMNHRGPAFGNDKLLNINHYEQEKYYFNVCSIDDALRFLF